MGARGNSALNKRKQTVAVLGFFGMALMYSIRFNLSIGIVAMVDHSKAKNHDNISLREQEICPALVHPVSSSIDGITPETSTSASTMSQGKNDNFAKFDWNEKEQGLILGCFFWGYVISQFPGGLMAQKFGGKWVLSLGLLGAGLLSTVLPFAVNLGGLKFVILVRFLQGLFEGVIIPSYAVILSKWTLPDERASMATLCFSGMPFGTALTMICSSYLISNFGWPAVFYAPGILTVIWFILWSSLVPSSPSEHSNLSKESDQHSNQSIKDIPWKAIFSSGPVWAILVSHFANTWGHNTLKTEGPKYLHSVLHFNIHENAMIAATPYLCQWLFCNIVTRLSDYLIRKRKISVATSRKLCNTIGQAGTAAAYACLILADCNRSLAIVAFVFSGLFNGAIYGGFLINPVDIAPNYAGVVEGIVNGLSNLAGFGAPFVAGLILHNEPSIYGWRYVFLIPAIGDFFGNLFFVLFSSAKAQVWDKMGGKTSHREILEKMI